MGTEELFREEVTSSLSYVACVSTELFDVGSVMIDEDKVLATKMSSLNHPHVKFNDPLLR